MIFSEKSDVGCLRTQNEDNMGHFFADNGDLMFFIVADGMGGHNSGEIASLMTVDIFKQEAELFEKRFTKKQDNAIKQIKNFTEATLIRANTEVFRKSFQSIEYTGMGTTAVSAIIYNGQIVIGNIGDSRAYLVGTNSIQRLTIDHSVVQNLIDNGRINEKEALIHPDKNIITRAIGAQQNIEVDIYLYEYSDDNILVLCSDGLNNMVDEDTIFEMVNSGEDTNQICDLLIDSAKKNGGLDNITVTVVKL